MKIKDLPEEIQEIALLRQEEHGNPRNAEIDLNKGQSEKGFTWWKTPEGYSFWEKIYNYSDYTEFYKKYPKLESKQYYTSIPTDVKLGDKFEIIGFKCLTGSNYTGDKSKKYKIGTIVSLTLNDKTDLPFFTVEGESDRQCFDWGWLKPVKDVSVNNKKIVVSKKVIDQITTSKSDIPVFKIEDEVELISTKELAVYVPLNSRGKVIAVYSGGKLEVQFESCSQTVFPVQLKLIKTDNNNGKIQNNRTESNVIFAIAATISTGSTPRGIAICSTRKEITLGG